MTTKNIVAFGASNSKESINKQLAIFAGQQVEGAELTVLDLNDFEMPIYGIDKENETGIPQKAHQFNAAIKAADGIIVSFAEHNGSYTAAYKNITDWVSRIDAHLWRKKPMLIMATSPGARGGLGVLESAYSAISYSKTTTLAKFSLPSFYDNFKPEAGITNTELLTEFKQALSLFEKAL